MTVRKVLVTGAAGSIGAEVCRVLVDAGVKVIGLDIAETPLFWLDKELEHSGDFTSVLGSVTDRHLVGHIMRSRWPQVVVHAAALKHVGMCEQNVCEAVDVNLRGTWVVSRAAKRYGARMVLISTDKAVEPTSIMGASKAAAERLLWGMPDARTIRLVNIWGSQGSLQHIINAQIDKGGPISITDWRMTRMFMSLGDAATLVGDEVFDTNTAAQFMGMGSKLRMPTDKRVTTRRIIDVIEEVKAFRGVPDMPVIEVGSWSGEKLEEKLLGPGDAMYRRRDVGWRWRMAARALLAMVKDRRPTAVRNGLFQLVRTQ